MIMTSLLTLVYVFVLGITQLLSLLGTVSLPTEMITGLKSLAPTFITLEFIFPVSTLISILYFELVFDGVLFSYKAIKWLYQKIPMIN